MPDFRISDTAPEHRKLRAVGPAGIGLWAMAGAYSMRELTDGWVPLYWVATWPSGKRLAGLLVTSGLWEPEQRDGIAGYLFHDWTSYQRSASTVEEERRKARERMASVRAGNVRPNKQRTFERTSGEGSPNVHDSLSLSLTSGSSRGVSYVSNAGENDQRPPEKCSKHANDPNPPACGGCGDARRARESWDRARALVVRACSWCDGDGWRWHPEGKRHGVIGERCNHVPPERQATG